MPKYACFSISPENAKQTSQQPDNFRLFIVKLIFFYKEKDLPNNRKEIVTFNVFTTKLLPRDTLTNNLSSDILVTFLYLSFWISDTIRKWQHVCYIHVYLNYEIRTGCRIKRFVNQIINQFLSWFGKGEVFIFYLGSYSGRWKEVINI